MAPRSPNAFPEPPVVTERRKANPGEGIVDTKRVALLVDAENLSALGQPRAKAKGLCKAEAGIGKSASWIAWFKKRPQAYEIEGRGTQSRARLKPAKKA